MRQPFHRALAALSAIGITTMATAATTEGPVALGVDRQGDAVTLVVRGAASAATEVTYELDVEGASTVHQRGRARLVPNGNEALVRVTINADRPWRATLRVTGDSGEFVQQASG